MGVRGPDPNHPKRAWIARWKALVLPAPSHRLLCHTLLRSLVPWHPHEPQRLGGITRAGDELLRSTLVVGATSVIQHVQRTQGRNASPWLLKLLERRTPKLAAIALANKIARIAWKLMVSGERYRRPVEHSIPAIAA